MKKPIEIRVRINVEFDSSEAILADYLHDAKVAPYPLREMVMLALKSYWLPFAYKRQKLKGEKLHQATLDSIYRLQLHLQYLQSMMGIKLERGELGIDLLTQSDTPSEQPEDSTVVALEATEDLTSEELEEDKEADDKWNVPFGFTSKLGESHESD